MNEIVKKINDLNYEIERYKSIHGKIMHVSFTERIFGKGKNNVLILFDEINNSIKSITEEWEKIKEIGRIDNDEYNELLCTAKIYFESAIKHTKVNQKLQELYRISFWEKFKRRDEARVNLNLLDEITDECIRNSKKYNIVVNKIKKSPQQCVYASGLNDGFYSCLALLVSV